MYGTTRGSDNTGEGFMGGNDNVGGGYGSSGTGAAGGYDQDSYGSGGARTGTKPSAGDKIMGGLEKAAGKMTKNQGMAEKGAERASGGDNY